MNLSAQWQARPAAGQAHGALVVAVAVAGAGRAAGAGGSAAVCGDERRRGWPGRAYPRAVESLRRALGHLDTITITIDSDSIS
jgi:hypothetical protein